MGFNSAFKGLNSYFVIMFGRFTEHTYVATSAQATSFDQTHMDWCTSKRPRIVNINTPAFYRVSIKSFPDYKHLLQENYVEYKHIFFTII